ncbi:MAG: hypothetical protein SGCHY_004768, partial [Lobulomycetales sp.]
MIGSPGYDQRYSTAYQQAKGFPQASSDFPQQPTDFYEKPQRLPSDSAVRVTKKSIDVKPSLSFEFERVDQTPGLQPLEGAYGQIICAKKKSQVADSSGPHSSRIYALKRTEREPSVGISPTTLREIVMMQELNHVNIMRISAVYRFVDEQGMLYMEMDCAKGDLNFLLNGPPMPHEDVRFYSLQILQGLDYCHRKQLIHRDLKPANMLVDHE